jgi:hypothetical protein
MSSRVPPTGALLVIVTRLVIRPALRAPLGRGAEVVAAAGAETS